MKYQSDYADMFLLYVPFIMYYIISIYVKKYARNQFSANAQILEMYLLYSADRILLIFSLASHLTLHNVYQKCTIEINTISLNICIINIYLQTYVTKQQIHVCHMLFSVSHTQIRTKHKSRATYHDANLCHQFCSLCLNALSVLINT